MTRVPVHGSLSAALLVGLLGFGSPAGMPPSAPSSITATAINSGRVDISWSAVTDGTGGVIFYVLRRGDGKTDSVMALSFSDTTVQPTTGYTYRVAAVDSTGAMGPFSSTVSVTTPAVDTSPPTPPTNPLAALVGLDQVDLNWTASIDLETGIMFYNIYRDGTVVGTSQTTSFSDPGLPGNTTFTYEISAVNGEGLEGNRSAAVMITTGDTTPPTAPGGLTGSAPASDQVDLSWSAATDPESGVASYNVYRDGTIVGTTAGTTFSDTGLTAGTTYRYEISAVNGDGIEGPRSNAFPITTPVPPDTTPPTQVTGLTATAGSPTSVTLAWSAASDPETGVTGYRVYRGGLLVATTTNPGFQDTGLQASTTYTYEVSAVNGQGLEGVRSAPATVTTQAPADPTPPTVPDGLTATAASPTRVDLSWNAAADPESGVTGYRVYRDGTLLASPAGTSFADTTAEENTAYSYQVSAVNGAGTESARSAAVSVTTPAVVDLTPPSAPTGLRVVSS